MYSDRSRNFAHRKRINKHEATHSCTPSVVHVTGRAQEVSGFFDRIDMGIDRIKYSKLDTNYIAAPKYKLMVAMVSKNAWGRDNVHIPFSWNDPDVYER